MDSDIYDEEWKFLLKEKVEVEKFDNHNRFTNTRHLQFLDRRISYYKTNQNSPKHQVKIENCKNILFQWVKNDQEFNFNIQFNLKHCLTNNQYLHQYQNKIIDWRFIVKNQKDVQKLKENSYFYKNYWIIKYLNAINDSKNYDQFFTTFSEHCIKSVNKFKLNLQSDTLKIKKADEKQQKIFRNQRNLTQTLQKVLLKQDIYIIVSLMCIVIFENEKYSCSLTNYGDLQLDDDEEYKQEILRIQDILDMKIQILDQYRLKIYKLNNGKKFGLLSFQSNKDNYSESQLLKNQNFNYEFFDEKQIFDSVQLSTIFHSNGLQIRSIGQFAQHSNNSDFKKFLKSEIIGRALKVVLMKKKQSLKQLVENFWVERQKDLYDTLYQIMIDKFQFDILKNKNIEQVQILILNSMMFHLNFYVPINMEVLLKKKDFVEFIDFNKLELVIKCKNYVGIYQKNIEQLFKFDYQYLQKQIEQNFFTKPKECKILCKAFLGQDSIELAKLIFEQSKKLKLNSQLLNESYDILKKNAPTNCQTKVIEQQIIIQKYSSKQQLQDNFAEGQKQQYSYQNKLKSVLKDGYVQSLEQKLQQYIYNGYSSDKDKNNIREIIHQLIKQYLNENKDDQRIIAKIKTIDTQKYEFKFKFFFLNLVNYFKQNPSFTQYIEDNFQEIRQFYNSEYEIQSTQLVDEISIQRHLFIIYILFNNKGMYVEK